MIFFHLVIIRGTKYYMSTPVWGDYWFMILSSETGCTEYHDITNILLQPLPKQRQSTILFYITSRVPLSKNTIPP